MKRIKQKLELAIYGYDPSEFMPIKRNGRLENRVEYIDYKVMRFKRRVASLR